MSETLRLCPFCGGEAQIPPREDQEWFPEKGAWTVWCKECGSEISCFDTKEEALAAWNRRHISSVFRHVAEKIRNAIRAGATVDVFGRKRLTGVVLDLEMAEEFVKEFGDD